MRPQPRPGSDLTTLRLNSLHPLAVDLNVNLRLATFAPAPDSCELRDFRAGSVIRS